MYYISQQKTFTIHNINEKVDISCQSAAATNVNDRPSVK